MNEPRLLRPVRATVITDASFCPETKATGWAAWIKVDGERDGTKRYGNLRRCETSTQAETMAAANGCWIAAYLGATHILLQSDCMAVIHAVGNKTKSPAIVGIWQELTTLPLMGGVTIIARHVKGHGPVIDSRTWVNDWCDRNAYKEMEKERESARGSARKGHRSAGPARRGKKEMANTPGSFCPRP